MGLAETIAVVLLGLLLAAYLLASEFLDTIGRLEILEKRWPSAWRAMSNRPFRLVMLVFLVVLVAKDVTERLHENEPAPVVVNIPPPPAPTIVMGVPNFSVAKGSIKVEKHKTGIDSVFVLITAKGIVENPAFEIACSRACYVENPRAIDSATYSRPIDGPSGSPSVTRIGFSIPPRLDNGKQLTFDVFSKEPSMPGATDQLSLTYVKLYSPKRQ